MKSIQSLRGTKDIIGKEGRKWECIEARTRSVFRDFGYLPIRTPILEETTLFKRSVGEATDIVEKEMYHFVDRSDMDIALRPEGTASVVRAYIEHHLGKERSVNRLYYHGPMFRAERPQAGRLRQFHQFGAECFGSNSVLADVEMMELMVRILEKLGIETYELEINNLGDLQDRERFSVILKDYFTKHHDHLTPEMQTRLKRNVFRLLDSKEPRCQELLDQAPRLAEHVSAESRRNFEAVCELLTKLGIRYRVNPRIVRGLDYYTHTVFELKHKALGAQDALAAGGRYDGLVERLGGPATPAVGFAMGVERLMIVLDQKQMEDKHPHQAVWVAWMGEAAKASAFEQTSLLRRNGIVSHIDFEGRSLKAQMRLANKENVSHVMIIGEAELKNKQVVLKDMRVKDSQSTIAIQDILPTLRAKVAI